MSLILEAYLFGRSLPNIQHKCQLRHPVSIPFDRKSDQVHVAGAQALQVDKRYRRTGISGGQAVPVHRRYKCTCVKGACVRFDRKSVFSAQLAKLLQSQPVQKVNYKCFLPETRPPPSNRSLSEFQCILRDIAGDSQYVS